MKTMHIYSAYALRKTLLIRFLVGGTAIKLVTRIFNESIFKTSSIHNLNACNLTNKQ